MKHLIPYLFLIILGFLYARECNRKVEPNIIERTIRKGRVLGRPTRFNLINELHELTDAELNIAFTLGLIGNNGRKGSIVENATLYKTN